MLDQRHIQTYGDANTTTKHYWAYPDRVLPCTSDSGTCEYLDAVYWMHTTSMLYTFILWTVIAGVLCCCLALRYSKSITMSVSIATPHVRGMRAVRASCQRWLLPEVKGRRLYGRVTMLQVLVLLILAAYLLIFSLVGIVYKTWITPVKKMPGLYNTRTGLGGFADRVGAMAYALTPLTVALSTRESVLSLITGIPYQHFNFLHRWTGRIIFLQSFLHTLGWTIVEGNLYRPQPKVYKAFIQEQYIVFGIVAQLLITFLYVFSTKWAIQWTGYEFFKRTHYAIAVLYLGACWGHWDGLACWMIAAIALLILDKGVRLLRTGLLHMGFRKGKSGLGFQCGTATLQHYGHERDSVIRLDFDMKHRAWQPGSHFYLCFPEISLWQSHPFTPASLPNGRSDVQHHTYLIRVRSGITKQLAELAMDNGSGERTTSVILTGPYPGSSIHNSSSNFLAIAGGTGVTSVLPAVLDALSSVQSAARVIDLVWIIKHTRDIHWLESELSDITQQMSSSETSNLRIRIFVTRESTPPEDCAQTAVDIKHDGYGADEKARAMSTSALINRLSGFETTYLDGSHSCIEDIVQSFAEGASLSGGSSHVIGAGPGESGTLLRAAVTKRNSAKKAWNGDESGEMSLDWECQS